MQLCFDGSFVERFIVAKKHVEESPTASATVTDEQTAAPISPPAKPGELIVAEAFNRGLIDRDRLTAEVREALNASTFIALRPDGEVMEANMANLDGEEMMLSCLARAKVPSGGGNAFRVFDVDGESTVSEIEGVICLQQNRGALWPNDDPKPGTLPYLVTNDMKVAYQLGDDMGRLDPAILEAAKIPPRPEHGGRSYYDWSKLEYTKFGSSTKGSGKGKRAKETKLLAILRKGDAFPILLNAPPTSVKNVKAFMLQLSPLPHFRAVVKLTLRTERNSEGIDYSKIEIKKVGALSKMEGEVIKRMYTDPLRALVNSGRLTVEADDFGDSDG